VGESQSTLAAEVEGSSSTWDSQAKLVPGINPTQLGSMPAGSTETQDPGTRVATSGVVAQMTGSKSPASAPQRRSSRHRGFFVEGDATSGCVHLHWLLGRNW
jgi:hypothetical protein